MLMGPGRPLCPARGAASGEQVARGSVRGRAARCPCDNIIAGAFVDAQS